MFPARRPEFALNVSFRRLDDYRQWRVANPHIDHDWVHALARRILDRGFEHPLTRETVAAKDIEPHLENPREGLRYKAIRCRERAVLHLLQHAVSGISRRNVAIYAPEAVTGFALVMRGMFPRFYGSEYTEEPELRQAMFPIPFQDLTKLELPSETFDIVVTNEVLEHVPSIDQALSEICRVLKPGGRHIGTVPFAAGNESGVVRAALRDGTIEHLLEPEFHGDPFGKSGSLVFEIPGWDLLARARAAMFSEAKMQLVASERYGYVGDDLGGIFALICQK